MEITAEEITTRLIIINLSHSQYVFIMMIDDEKLRGKNKIYGRSKKLEQNTNRELIRYIFLLRVSF